MPRPNLTIEIDDPNDQLDPNAAPHLLTAHPEPQTRLLKKQNSVRSINSNTSNKSEREIIIERSHRELIQSRLSRNIQSLNKLNGSLSRSRASSRMSRKALENSIHRSKSTSEIGGSKSRVAILHEIAEKLQNLHRKDSNHQRLPSNTGSRVSAYQGSERGNNRSTKLNSLLQQIKKCNQESNKAVYTIKKSRVEDSAKPKNNTKKISAQKEPDVRQLAQELRDVRRELDDAKKKNQELINLAKGRGESSRISSRTNNLNESGLINVRLMDSHWKYSKEKNADNYSRNTILNVCPTCGCACQQGKRWPNA